MHLLCFFRPMENRWKCQWAECSSLHLEKRHWKRHEDDEKFTDQRLTSWCESVKAIPVLISRQWGEFVGTRVWLQDKEPTVSVSCKVLGEHLAVYWRETVETVAATSLGNVAAVRNFRMMMGLLAEVAEEMWTQVRQATLLDGSVGVLHGTVAIDGYCHP